MRASQHFLAAIPADADSGENGGSARGSSASIPEVRITIYSL
jgi:hypothetical protein